MRTDCRHGERAARSSGAPGCIAADEVCLRKDVWEGPAEGWTEMGRASLLLLPGAPTPWIQWVTATHSRQFSLPKPVSDPSSQKILICALGSGNWAIRYTLSRIRTEWEKTGQPETRGESHTQRCAHGHDSERGHTSCPSARWSVPPGMQATLQRRLSWDHQVFAEWGEL